MGEAQTRGCAPTVLRAVWAALQARPKPAIFLRMFSANNSLTFLNSSPLGYALSGLLLRPARK